MRCEAIKLLMLIRFFLPAVATMQWNNLLEPEGNKTLDFTMPMKKIRCPSEKTPYLFTKLNSRSFFSLGKQR
jgi:hypothetical protein